MEKAPACDQNRLIQGKGLAHEAAFLERLKRENAHLVDVAEGNSSFARRVKLTVGAMKAGADIIFQASLQEGAFIGHADFLRKVPRASALGDHSYEVIDTKLAKSAKAKFLVQVARRAYTGLLSTRHLLRGVWTDPLHLGLGSREALLGCRTFAPAHLTGLMLHRRLRMTPDAGGLGSVKNTAAACKRL